MSDAKQINASRPTRDEALAAVKTLISWIEGGIRDGTEDTPERVIRAWENDWGTGYNHDRGVSIVDGSGDGRYIAEDVVRVFPHSATTSTAGLVIVRDIAFNSHCEHHMAPFFGTAAIGYIPGRKGILGISKFARVVDRFARRLQVQERLTEEIADFLCTYLSPDIIVEMRATHMCMVSRGVKQATAQTITASVRGVFDTDMATRAEFYSSVARAR